MDRRPEDRRSWFCPTRHIILTYLLQFKYHWIMDWCLGNPHFFKFILWTKNHLFSLFSNVFQLFSTPQKLNWTILLKTYTVHNILQKLSAPVQFSYNSLFNLLTVQEKYRELKSMIFPTISIRISFHKKSWMLILSL